MQTVWKGSISFRLVSIPVRLASAIPVKELAVRQVHAAHRKRIPYHRVCGTTAVPANRGTTPARHPVT